MCLTCHYVHEGIVPLEWKEANIIPLFKKGSRSKAVNYRPVSLTSVICKLLESIIRDHIMDFLIKHKLINSSQHGFLKSKSCLTNLLCFFEEVTKWVDEGSPVDIMNYEMGGTILSKTVKEKDLGVTINANMKVSEQCRIAASKGNQILGMIRRNIT